MNPHKVGSWITITWHPNRFDLIGLDGKITSNPFKLLDRISEGEIVSSQPGWIKYLHLDFQTVTSPRVVGTFMYPCSWMLPVTNYGNPYKIDYGA